MGGDCSPRDGNVSTRAIGTSRRVVAAADTGGAVSSRSRNATPCDADFAARCVVPGTNTRAPAASARDGAAFDDDIATGQLKAPANTGAVSVSACGQGTVSADCQSLVRRNMDAGIGAEKTLESILAREDKSGITLTGKSGPRETGVVSTPDGDSVKGDGRTVGNGNLVVARESSIEGCTIGGREISKEGGEIDCFGTGGSGGE